MVRTSTRKRKVRGTSRDQDVPVTSPSIHVPDSQENVSEPVQEDNPNPEEEQVPEVSVAGPSSKKQKKEKTAAILSEEEENTMVEWLESNPILYNKKLKTYKDSTKKEALWREKAQEMDKDVTLLKTWYSSLRTRFGRLRKFSSGQGPPEMTERDLWIIRSFEFLKPHIIEVPKRTLVSVCIPIIFFLKLAFLQKFFSCI